MVNDRFIAERFLGHLKDFQLRTVDHVFERLYGSDGAGRFLVADEVGLGKTLVARGIVARSIEYLQDKQERIDIIYICSNAAIARQNIARLNVNEDGAIATCRRLTLLPIRVNTLTKTKAKTNVNFISFTPGTTFYLKSRMGTSLERGLIYQLLKDTLSDHKTGLFNFLRGFVNFGNWNALITQWNAEIDETLASEFRLAFSNDQDLLDRFIRCCDRFTEDPEKISKEHAAERSALIGEIRRLLAETCLQALKPSLVILDEFQRFKDLIHSKDEAGQLAQGLFSQPDVKVLLLSATPYKMLSLGHENDDNHYRDFIETLRFLLDGSPQIDTIIEAIQTFRKGLIELPWRGHSSVTEARDRLRNNLIDVMCRTERVGMTQHRDSMLSESIVEAKLHTGDLRQAALAEKIAKVVKSQDTIEYWKSGPYLLNFMRNYDLRRKFDSWSKTDPGPLVRALKVARRQLLNFDSINKYHEVAPANARMRTLFEDTIEKGLWRLLWMPPSLPYSTPRGNYQGVGPVTKSLVFSSWNMVPDMIAGLCSYEAERRMVTRRGDSTKYNELSEAFRPLMRFNKSRDEIPSGMPTLLWLFPSPTLAEVIDPLEISLRLGGGKPVLQRTLMADARARCNRLLDTLPPGKPGKRPDERWYWAAIALLDVRRLGRWCQDRDGWAAVYSNQAESDSGTDEDSATAFREHLYRFISATEDSFDLGPRPKDLANVIAELAVAGPGTCSLRALKRISPELAYDDPLILSGAARIAEGFRTLFNIPATIALLRRGSGKRYWRTALDHSIDGNIQALLDEQTHVLLESQGLMNKEPHERVAGVSEVLADSLSLLPSRVRVQDVRPRRGRIQPRDFNLRCRFALRFGGLIDERDSSVTRADTVREAFNSPFRPFVLASTSVGQEGLDFHTWCHRVVHWNLPPNPVDLEQREGRVHRYKGHAVRKNIAEIFGLESLLDWDKRGDPWAFMFNKAVETRSPDANDIVPYWVFDEGAARIERRVPVIPFSKEVQRFEVLKRGLALYRLVFGQPRQEELLAFLASSMSEEAIEEAGKTLLISLEPPANAPTSGGYGVNYVTVD